MRSASIVALVSIIAATDVLAYNGHKATLGPLKLEIGEVRPPSAYEQPTAVTVTSNECGSATTPGPVR